MKTFIYRLVLKEHLLKEENWTSNDESIVSKHFARLQEMNNEGTLLLAGKTEGLDASTYGIVLFKALNLKQAEIIMKEDPAIQAGIMDGTLHEYNLALHNTEFEL